MRFVTTALSTLVSCLILAGCSNGSVPTDAAGAEIDPLDLDPLYVADVSGDNAPIVNGNAIPQLGEALPINQSAVAISLSSTTDASAPVSSAAPVAVPTPAEVATPAPAVSPIATPTPETISPVAPIDEPDLVSPKPDSEPDPVADPKPDSEPEPVADPKPDSEPDSVADPKPDSEPEPDTDPDTDVEPDVVAEKPNGSSGPTPSCNFPDQFSAVQTNWTDGNSGASVPGFQGSMSESSSNTAITRVSSNGVWGVGNGQAVHHYSKRQAWNADDSLIDIGERLVDANNFNLVSGPIPMSSERNWSNLDPDVMIGIQYNPLPNELVKWNIKSNQIDVLKRFDGFTSCTMGDYEGNVSNNDERVLVACTNQSSGQRTLISYDIANSAVLGQIPAQSNFNWGSFSQSGDYILVENNRYPDSNPRLLRYNPDFSGETFLTSDVQHGDFGFDDNGDEVYAMLLTNFYYIRLRDGARVDMTSLTSNIGIGWGHLSCRGTGRPGWCYYTATQNSMVGAVKLSASDPKVEHWGFHRSNYGSYNTQPKGTVSRSGEKVLLISNWYGRGEINDYMVSCNGS